MTSGTVVGAAPRFSTNGHARKTHGMTPEEVAESWKCKKRDGTVVAFDCGKIRKVLYKCFYSVSKANSDLTQEDLVAATELVVEDITKAVINSIEAQHLKEPTVEQVQQFVIQQLWAKGLFDAGEHYQNYREEHRRKRLSGASIPAEVQERFTEMKQHFPYDLQIYQLMAKFAKWDDNKKRRETWKELVYDRVCPWLFRRPEAIGKLTAEEQQELADALYNLEASPAMRIVQMAGPALDRCNVGAYNCAYAPTEDIKSFSELLYILMQGTGQGFSTEREYVDELPRVKKQKGKTENIVVDDSTEGWCDAYDKALTLLWDGWDFTADVTGVRKKNTRLKTKGGRASGPEPFVELLDFSRNLIKSIQGKYMEPQHAHRLNCFTGRIVQVGGVRRAAEIGLSDLDDHAVRDIKSGAWWANGNGLWADGRYLSMSNNSAVYNERPSMEVFMAEWLSLVKSKSGERGIFNRQAALKHSPSRRKWGRHKPGCNPCAEILLRPYQFCNLSMAIARADDTVESLKKKVRIAALFGKLQSLATDFNYIRPEWKKNCEEERLLGVDITGQAECPLLQFGAPGRSELLRELNKVVQEVDIKFSIRFGVNRSAANTTVKPGGDSAVFFHCGSGVTPWFSEHQWRWVREPKETPVARFLVDSGVPYANAPEAPNEMFVFRFPKSAPKGATLRNDMTALQQFENWLDWKQNWAEHSVSATIYAEDHEWMALGAKVYENFDHITGLSFLPKDNGTYTFAPNEEVTKEVYEKGVAEFPDLNWAKLTEYEDDDQTVSSGTMACHGGKCD